MTTVEDDAAGRSAVVPPINAFLSPVYWGSLAAFVFTLVASVVITITNGPPAHLVPLTESASGGTVVFVSSVVIVGAYVIRSYSAVAVEMYGLDEMSMFATPRGFRRALFVVLTAIVLLAGLNAFLISVVGVFPALLACAVQSGLAILTLIGVWVSKQFRPELFKNAVVPFAGGEFLFATLVALLLLSLGSRSDDATTAMLFGAGVAWTVWFTAHEWLHRYSPTIQRQLRALRTVLDKK